MRRCYLVAQNDIFEHDGIVQVVKHNRLARLVPLGTHQWKAAPTKVLVEQRCASGTLDTSKVAELAERERHDPERKRAPSQFGGKISGQQLGIRPGQKYAYVVRCTKRIHHALEPINELHLVKEQIGLTRRILDAVFHMPIERVWISQGVVRIVFKVYIDDFVGGDARSDKFF